MEEKKERFQSSWLQTFSSPSFPSFFGAKKGKASLVISNPWEGFWVGSLGETQKVGWALAAVACVSYGL